MTHRGVLLLLLCTLLLSLFLSSIECATPLNPPSQLLVDWKPAGFAQGIESRFPTFSWAVTVGDNSWIGYVQTSYQILVASSLKLINSGVGDVWDSGVVVSNESSNVIFMNGFDAKQPFSLHRALFAAKEDLRMECEGNRHISSLDEFIWESDSESNKKEIYYEALKRRCRHQKSCTLPSSHNFATLIWTCTENSLLPRTTYYWTVRSNYLQATVPFAEPSQFTTSLYGEWNDAVAIYGKSPSGFVYLRTEQNFTNPASCALQAATIYVTGAESNKLLSAYKLYVNNQWIGSGPGRNNSYNQQVYDTFNVLNIFQNFTQGNEIPIVLAAECFHLTSGAFQLSLDFQFLCSNSSSFITTVISSSQKWKSFPANSIYNPTGSSGVVYTQPHEYINGENWIDNWKEFGFDDSAWDYASLTKPFAPPLIAKPTIPVAVSVVPIVYLNQTGNSTFFYLEREVMGGLILSINNPNSSPVQIEIRLGEELNGPESVMYKMRTGNVYQDFWTLKPGMNNLYHHEYMEWRYGQILNIPSKLQISNINVWTYNYPFDDSLSSFQSSSAELNEIYELCKYTVKATSLDMLTDSNTRERQPYEADMYITSMSLLSVMPSFPIVRMTLAWLLEYPTWPTEWHLLTNSAAYLDYMATGDPWIAENFWSTLSANSFVQQYFNSTLGLLEKPVDASNGINDLVDWPAVMRDNYVMTNVDTVINAHVYHAANILAEFAQITNRTSSAPLFQNAAAQIYKNVNSKLINSTGIYVDGLNINHTAAHASAFALAFGLVDSSNYNSVISFLLEKGMVGSPYFAHFLLDGLYGTQTALGAQGAFSLITSTLENSWLAMIRNGATMTSEMWSATEKPNMSWSHPWSTTPLIMITQRIMGITPLSPSFSRALISPLPPPNLALNASITTPTIKGPFSLQITTTLNQDPTDDLLYDGITMLIIVPANVVTEAMFPFAREGKREGKRRVQVVVNGKEIEEEWEGRFLKMAKNLGGGRHELSARIAR